MNFFYLDKDPVACANSMVDRHVVKMILEHCQMLSTVQHLNGIDALYKPTHANHPCTIWARQSIQNYDLLIEYTKNIIEEYNYRYNKQHACISVLYFCESVKPNLPDIGLTKIALAMPDKYKSDDPVQSYREYYKNEKRHIAVWSKRNKPDWWE